MDWTDDSGVQERYKEWIKKVKMAFRVLKFDKVDPGLYVEAIYQWSQEQGRKIIDENVHLIVSDKADATTADHKKEREENWEKHLQMLGKGVEPRGSHLIAFIALQNRKEGSSGISSFITELREYIKLLTFCEECSDKYLCYALATGNKDSKSFSKCLDLSPDEKSAKVIDIITKDRATNDFLKGYNGKADVHYMGTKKKGKGKNPQHIPSSPQGSPRTPSTPNQSHYKQHQQYTPRSDKCSWCGNNKHPREQCPATDVVCSKCKRRGHFAKVCMSGKHYTRQVKELSTSEPTPYDTSTLPNATFGTLKATKIGSLRTTQVNCL
jgi:hypothetical protein